MSRFEDGTSGNSMQMQITKNRHTEAPQDILLDKKPTSLYLSRRFAKRLLVIGISEVCRKRLSFPEEYFILRLAGDMKVRVLNPFGDDGINRNVSMMKKWIRKILELTEKGWLDKVLITLSTAEVPCEDPQEIFAFSLTEKNSVRQVEEHKIFNITEEEDKKLEDEAEKLLKELKIQVRSRKELPDNFNFSVQIVTSKYAPKNLMMEDFVSTTKSTKSAESANVFLRREVQTKFHKFGVVGVALAESDKENYVSGAW